MTVQTKIAAAVYIGASSAQLLLARVSGDDVEPINEFSAITGLSSELAETNLFPESALKRTRRILSEFRDIAVTAGALSIRSAVANTLSDASNKAELMLLCKEMLGAYPRMLGPRDESKLIYHGIVTGAYAETPVIAVYNGYNNTPVAFGTGEKIGKAYDLPVGAGFVGREFHTAEMRFGPLSAWGLRKKIASFFRTFRGDVMEWKRSFRVSPTVFLAGPFPTACAKLAGERFDECGGSFSAPIPAKKLHKLSRTLLSKDPEERAKIPGLDPAIVPYAAGCAVLMSEFLKACGENSFVVAPNGFCIGLLKLPEE